jgi:hypothetical protein
VNLIACWGSGGCPNEQRTEVVGLLMNAHGHSADLGRKEQMEEGRRSRRRKI